MFRLLFWAAVTFLPQLVTAQQLLHSLADARALGQAGAGVALVGLPALWMNPAGIPTAKKVSYGATVSQRFALRELTVAHAGVVYRGFGLQLASTGFGDYRANKLGIVYARLLSDRWRIGGSLSGWWETIRSYGTDFRVTPNLGVRYQASQRFCLGASLRHQPLSNEAALSGVFGLAYSFTSDVRVFMDAEYGERLSARWGIAYLPVPEVELRAGFRSRPAEITFGASYLLPGGLYITAAGAQHPQLGVTTGLGLYRDPAP